MFFLFFSFFLFSRRNSLFIVTKNESNQNNDGNLANSSSQLSYFDPKYLINLSKLSNNDTATTMKFDDKINLSNYIDHHHQVNNQTRTAINQSLSSMIMTTINDNQQSSSSSMKLNVIFDNENQTNVQNSSTTTTAKSMYFISDTNTKIHRIHESIIYHLFDVFIIIIIIINTPLNTFSFNKNC